LCCLIGLAWGQQDGESCITHQCAKRMCPMTIQFASWDAFQYSVSFLLAPSTHSQVSARRVLLVNKFFARFRVRIWRIPPQDVIYQNSSSILALQEYLLFFSIGSRLLFWPTMCTSTHNLILQALFDSQQTGLEPTSK
jgi:hypothetical protein